MCRVNQPFPPVVDVLFVAVLGACLIAVALMASDMIRGCVRDEPCAASERTVAE